MRAILSFPEGDCLRRVGSERASGVEHGDSATASFVGRSEAHLRVLRELLRFAPFDVPVLLTGETGTGKSHAARLLHAMGRRSERPFLEVNCNTLPEGLIESELFGALPGSHSTATRAQQGKLAAAAGGTLFLDEIGDLPLSAQGKLLQLLESGVYFPLGSARAQHADVRLVAATNVDLTAAVRERRLRSDLYYRLRVAQIHLPSLKQRREDVALLATHFCRGACQRHGLPDLRLAPALLRSLERLPWPGNARELAHLIEAACIRCAQDGDATVEATHAIRLEPGVEGDDPVLEDRLGLREATRRFQVRMVNEALRIEGGRVSAAARRLRVSRSHFYALLRDADTDLVPDLRIES